MEKVVVEDLYIYWPPIHSVIKITWEVMDLTSHHAKIMKIFKKYTE